MKKQTYLIFLLINITFVYTQKIIDPFSQPNDSTLTWYGSGDVDGDNDVDWDDYNAMPTTLNDMADLDGDGTPSTAADHEILYNHINSGGLLPSDWLNQTREGKREWLHKMLTIDLTDTITYRSSADFPDDTWMCGNYSMQTIINFHGFKANNQFEMNLISTKYDTTNNGRFNIPIYYLGFSSQVNNVNHACNACLIGDNPLDPYDWIYPDQQNNGPLNHLFEFGANWNPGEDFKFAMAKMDTLNSAFTDRPSFVTIHWMLQFEMDSTIKPYTTWYSEYLLLEKPTVAIEDEKRSIPEGYSLEQNYPNPFNPITTVQYTLDISSNVEFYIYDIGGRLVDNINIGYLGIGNHEIQFNSNDMSSGIYFYQLSIDGFLSKPMKMTILK